MPLGALVDGELYVIPLLLILKYYNFNFGVQEIFLHSPFLWNQLKSCQLNFPWTYKKLHCKGKLYRDLTDIRLFLYMDNDILTVLQFNVEYS